MSLCMLCMLVVSIGIKLFSVSNSVKLFESILNLSNHIAHPRVTYTLQILRYHIFGSIQQLLVVEVFLKSFCAFLFALYFFLLVFFLVFQHAIWFFHHLYHHSLHLLLLVFSVFEFFSVVHLHLLLEYHWYLVQTIAETLSLY